MSGGTGSQDCASYSSKAIIDACILKQSRLNDISYMNQSIQKNDSSLCKKILDTEIRTQCFDTFIINRAKEEKNVDLCESMSEAKKDTCKQAVSFTKDTDTYQIALKEKNEDTCTKIVDTQLQETCARAISNVTK